MNKKIRDDLSEKLIHLTRSDEVSSGRDKFLKILDQKEIFGTNVSIRSKQSCICFSEAPISSLGRIIAAKEKNVRYTPYGFMFSKEYIFSLGGRPVIYQTENEYTFLPQELQYKHVAFELLKEQKTIDWTWEREWRLKAEKLSLDSKKVTLIIPNRILLEEIIGRDQSRKRAVSPRIFGAFPQTQWHFIVLEDLGFEVNVDE
jgi:hypothetical protein